MKLAWSTPEIDEFNENELEELLKHLKANIFSGIEPLFSSRPNFDPVKLKQLLRANDQEIIGFRTGGIAMKHRVSFSDPDPSVRERAIEHFFSAIQYATDFDVPLLLVGLLQGQRSPSQPYPAVRKNIIECLIRCASQAAKNQITLGLEPVNRYLLGYHATANEIIELIKEINLPNIRLLLDTYHMNMEERCMEETLIASSPWLVHVHLSDNNRHSPGRGSLNFSRILKVLEAINYKGYVSIESDDADWFAAIAESSKLLLPLINKNRMKGS